MDQIILPSRLSESWLDAETLSILKATLAPLDDAQEGAPIAFMTSATLHDRGRIDPIIQIVLAGSSGGLPPDPHRITRIMDCNSNSRANLALGAISLHGDTGLPLVLRVAQEIRATRHGYPDVYITRDAILLLNTMGEWDRVIEGGQFADQDLRGCAMCLFPRPTSAHQALELTKAPRGMGALAEVDVSLPPTDDGKRRRLLDPILEGVTPS